MTDAILTIDQGTTSTKCALVVADGTIVARGAARVASRFPLPGWVEQDADDIWRSVLDAVARCLSAAPVEARPIALAISNQRESAVVWRRADGTPVGPVIGWQDNRTAPACDGLRAAGAETLVRERTGLALDPMFSATKLHWLLERAPGGLAAARRGELCAGTIDAWLTWKLTGGTVFACEAGNASRTLLLDLQRVEWEPELLELFGVPGAALPEVRRSDGGFGRTVASGPLGAGLPIAAVLADSHAALYGQGCFRPGGGKATYGTGTSVMAPLDAIGEPPAGVSQTLAWLTDRPTWALEGNIIASGAALDWMSEILGVDGAAGLQALAGEVDSSDGVHLVPAFAGLGAPYWDRDAVGLISGVTRGTRPPHLARAALEAVAFQVADVLDAMDAATPKPLQVLHADGGASAATLLMQLQADLSGRPVRASETAEMSGLGAAHMAGTASGLWAGEEALAALPRPSRTFRPGLAAAEREAQQEAWHRAVARSRARPDHPAPLVLAGEESGGFA
jgi:glycerol kinase